MDHRPDENGAADVVEQQLADLVFDIKDWQVTHGMLLKYGPDVERVNSVPIGVSLRPSPFPRRFFEEAQKLQPIYNRLYAAISEDEQWLFGVLKGLIQDGAFAATLWRIYEQVKQEGYVQPITLGIFRSDYMVHIEDQASPKSTQDLRLKQVEFNTYSVAGGAHSSKTTEMHQYMYRTRAYDFTHAEDALATVMGSRIPANNTIASTLAGLCDAHAAYGPGNSSISPTPAVLFVVQPRNMNICDERPLEYALWNLNPGIPAYRVIFGDEVLARVFLSPTKELLFRSPPLSAPVEIAVVYMRAGYDVEEYTPAGCAARLMLEKSRAIKCPSIKCHLATFKKVQQELAVPGVLQRFLSPGDVDRISKTFAPMYPMDESSEAGKKGRKLALDPEAARNHVLKPSLEGGGHNIYGADIPGFLRSMPEFQWHAFILMELINPSIQKSMLLTTRGMYYDTEAVEDHTLHDTQHDPSVTPGDLVNRFGGPTVSELGIFGVCMWRTESHGPADLLINSEAGWSFKTKPASMKEMSVVKGYGCFDSPSLVG